ALPYFARQTMATSLQLLHKAEAAVEFLGDLPSIRDMVIRNHSQIEALHDVLNLTNRYLREISAKLDSPPDAPRIVK
ncbi:MAG: hypothetical protein R6X16_11340, partial [Anaerolineae bacterium]